MISIGILGCGRIGQVHARSVVASRRARLEAVQHRLDEHPEKMRQLRETVEHPSGTIA